jgi:hypothetical protein
MKSSKHEYATKAPRHQENQKMAFAVLRVLVTWWQLSFF